jgi:hypothetical protein
MSAEGATGRLQGAPLSIKTNAFHAPKLKRDVASKLQTKQPSDRPVSGSQRQAVPKEAEPENIQSGAYEAAGSSPPAAHAASLAAEKNSKPAPAVRLTTARKGKRGKARTGNRNSEVTVYYDVVQSPDDAVAKPQQKQKQQRTGRAAASTATAAEQGTIAATTAAGGSDHGTFTAAWTAEEDEMFPTQPEPMDADYGDQEEQLLPASAGHNGSGSKAAAAAAAAGGSERVLRSSSSGSLEQAAAAARSSGERAGRSSRQSRHREEPVDAADDSPASDAAADEAAAAAVPAGSQPARLRDGAEIFKYMQALAEDAAELLPQEQEQKKRGRGRAKKDLRLVDALHQCWQGKVRLRTFDRLKWLLAYA